ncbi:MAG TPA: energy-coupling factor ABC transporter ATP-binding protein [Candidatus Desulfovibrio gallistercoris]|uniref:energy-coupling factor ABC transporter ATP-binding protein n=1 Tax=uncultured Desulfovibrio sp. TaxID=167968 RepID=UPI001F9CC2D9|nr:ABC transporter ATP-binding protein [uncultured Desulfovibrio sp.]HJA77897.1 energy-coupling factor ABC transporter ATP-binding protein [Candidatus Desulfovibrio gallistercoris]
MNGNAPLFCLEDLTLTHEGCTQPVLRDVSFCLHPGEHIGLYGPNGCGKTTLLRGITGLHKATGGGVRFQGKLLRDDADFHPLRCAVGFVLQHAEDQLFFPTVLEDVAFGPLNLGLSPDAARERALETLARLGLDGFADRQTHALSGGEKKLVSLAGVLAMQPQALLLDEPTNALDMAARQRLLDILAALPTARITISHDWDFLQQVSNRFMTIEDGRLVTDAPSLAHVHRHAHPCGHVPHVHA